MQGAGIDPADGDGFAVLLAQPSAVNIRRARRKDQQHGLLRFHVVPLPVELAAALRLRVAQEDQAGTLSWGSVASSLIGQSQCLCRVPETSAGTNGVTEVPRGACSSGASAGAQRGRDSAFSLVRAAGETNTAIAKRMGMTGMSVG